MKRRMLVAFLIVCLLVCLLAPVQAADDVCFIAANEELLQLSAMPYITGGTVYVPYWVFTNYFGLYYNYFSDSVTASIYTAEKQFYFDMSAGTTYDANDQFYSADAVFRNGQVYLPAAFICNHFGLSYSYISGMGYGDVVRIKSGAAVLSDGQFFNAASQLMRSRYKAYKAESGVLEPGARPDGSSDPDDHADTRVYVSFQGMPSDGILKSLDSRAVKSCFFVTASQIRENPDRIRTILNRGHRIGIYCGWDAAADYAEASAVLYEAAREKTLLVTATPGEDEACRQMAEEQGLVFWSYDLDGVRDGEGISNATQLTTLLAFRTERADVRLICNEGTEKSLPGLLFYLDQNNFGMYQLREVDNYVG